MGHRFLRCAALFLLSLSLSGQTQWPPQSQQLLDRARAANPQRAQYAMDQGAKLYPTSDGRSFYLVWYPKDVPQRNHPLIVSLHGSASWAFDEFFLWRQQAQDYGYGFVALQWWFGGPDAPDAYYAPADLHRELRAALRRQENQSGTALLHGFSRGASNIYGVMALDRQSRDYFYAMTLANAGGASVDFPPNVAISNGAYGYDVFAGTYWTMFCGGMDPTPDRDGCPAMQRTSRWVEAYGGVTTLLIQDSTAGHGGFHQTPAHMKAALDAFRDNLAVRRAALPADTTWNVIRDARFEIATGSVSNVGLVNGEVWLTAATSRGMQLFRSADGTSQDGMPIAGLADALRGSDYNSGEVVPRQDRDGKPLLYVLGLAGPGVNRSVVFRLKLNSDNVFVRDPAAAVFAGGPDDGQFLGVPDITEMADGKVRLTYVALGAARQNSRMAVSSDSGMSFTAEFTNPFGDFAIPNPTASTNNVDPAILRLERGGFLAVTMRGARLFLFNSVDGRTFVPAPNAPIEAAQIAPGNSGLFDPTLLQLPDGRIFMYVTAGSNPSGGGQRIVRAELVAGSPTAVRNAASFQNGIAPGSIISIFGSNLATGTSAATRFPLPLELAGASVRVNGIAAPLLYASPSQINAQLPYELKAGSATLNSGAISLLLPIAAAAPGIFQVDGMSAAAGDVITIYLTGQGEIAPAVPTGSAAPNLPLSRTTLPASATVGGKDATIQYSGLTPGYAGLAQVNLVVPDLPAGEALVQVTVGGAQSNPINISITKAK